MGALFVVLLLYLLNIWINWSILQSMYSVKFGLDWIQTVFYHGYTFAVAAFLALLVINPLPGHSDLFSAASAITSRDWNFVRNARFNDFRDYKFYSAPQAAPPHPSGFSLSLRFWALWQVAKYVVAYFVFVGLGGLPIFGNLTMPVLMAAEGYGSWGLVPRIMELPVRFASSGTLVTLLPTMQVQFFLLYGIVGGIMMALVVRLVMRAARDIARGTGNEWIRDIILIFTAILGVSLLGVPYWATNAVTPYIYGIMWALFAFTVLGWVYFKLSGKGLIPVTAKRRRLIMFLGAAMTIFLLVNVAASTFTYLNWNNRWPEYEWTPQIQKQIAVTDFTSGVSGLKVSTLNDLPQGNVSSILSLVRQWGQSQAQDTMTKEIGAYNWMAPSSSQIVFVNDTEYWVAPTTIIYPSGHTDWISEHLIYTHSDRMMVINTHSGQEAPVSQAFAAPEPLIYYGEGSSFTNNVYVHVNGYQEINNQSYPGAPDYTLSGLQRMTWFLLRGQLGFAFSPPQDSIPVLYNRNIFNRVGEVLINGLQEDPAAYMVTNGTHLFYVVQLYIDYPLNSGFSQSPYMRFFGVVVIDPTDGTMRGYTVPNQNYTDGFLMSFYKSYYSTWKPAPSWLVPQLRYPEALLGSPTNTGQLNYNFFFHVTDPFVWRSGSGFYELPPSNSSSSILYISYVIGNKTYFVGLQEVEYASSASKNLAGLYVIFGGDRLGQMYLYQTPSNTTSTLLGPSAAVQAISINPQVRTLLTFLPNYNIGNTLLYVINGQLYYFIPVYTQPGGSNQVIIQMPFITIVDPYTGAVAEGPTAVQAYEALVKNLTVAPPLVGVPALEGNVTSFFTDQGLTPLNATQVNANAWVQVANLTYASTADWPSISSQLSSFVNNYAKQNNATVVLVDRASSQVFFYGFLVQKQVATNPNVDILVFYYVQVNFKGG